MMPNYWRNVLSVFTGSAVAQLIPVLGALIIARQYGPEEFGKFSAWLGVVVVASTMLTARLEISLVLERDGRFRNIAAFVVLITTFLLGLLGAGSVAIYYFLIENEYFNNIYLLGLLIPCSILFSLNQIWQSWAAADGRYRELNILRVTQAVCVVVPQIIAGELIASASSLAFAFGIGLLASQIVAVKIMTLSIPPLRKWKKLTVGYWRRHKKFPIYSLPADTINALAIQLPVLIVASRFGAESAGFLALAIRVLGMPLSFLGKAVLDVFKRQASVAYRDRGECRSEYMRTFFVLSGGSLIFVLSAYFLSEPAFGLAFGAEWLTAGTYSVLLLPMFAFRFVASPLSYIIYIVNKQQVDLFWQIALLLVTVVSLSYSSSVHGAILLYSWGYSVLYIVYLIISYIYSKGNQPLRNELQ
ncbi:lipopolysaccharide biosynthesis protein [Pusillimonas sp. ANT_WB101]|uniref:lipopolysaccharide biosynthesis protein n=1 Tax=Pusillimonas sp. ANT_WB101 TaxID=2597356 RepID=UPI0011ED4D24|nr:oligosaccharide flippase family protein [Pusillimonas sp. ANT_WB101]KAA0889517.1 oligosaccharide flippase family protein [Pusillimonas sp. ANT_WB101]